jgi:glutamine synthetase
MALPEIRDAKDVHKLIEERSTSHVYVALTDMRGILRGKYISKEKFLSALQNGIPCDPNLMMTVCGDSIYPVQGLTAGKEVRFGWGHGRIIAESCREIPWEPPDRNLIFLTEFTDSGAAFEPRCILGRLLEKAKSMGYRVFHACEFEFRLFKETTQSAFEKGYRDLELVFPNSEFLSITRFNLWSDFFNELIKAMAAMDIGLESLHWELGPGFGEAVIRYAEGIKAGDDAILYREFAKLFAHKHDLLMSFMAKWSQDADGQSCHIHVSLRDLDDKPVFYDSQAPKNMSRTMRHFTGGIQRLMPEFMLMYAPNINSYKRFVPGAFAPIAANWDVDNRTTAIRIISAKPESFRIENRAPGADVNPYLALAATLASGLWGIENSVEPSDPTEGNCYELDPQEFSEHLFPETYKDAIECFRTSELAKELFGEEFVRVYTESRTAHEQEYRARITQWELRNFLDLA